MERRRLFRHLFANFKKHGVDLAPHRQIVGAPRRLPDRCVSVMPAIWSIISLTSSCRTSLR
jgi:hypothetical protein